MLQISWMAKKSNKAVLEPADKTRSLINRISKHQAIFLVCDEEREAGISGDN